MINDLYWVYITCDPRADNRLQAALAPDLTRMLRDSAHRPVIYYRQFPITLDAVAHKLLLGSLEKETLNHLIRSVNPAMTDLREEFEMK